MSKWCYNYDSGEYEDIDKDGYSWTQGEYVSNWDDSEYQCEEEEQSLFDEEEQSLFDEEEQSLFDEEEDNE